MIYRGVVRACGCVELQGGATLPEGTLAAVIPEDENDLMLPVSSNELGEWLRVTREARERLSKTSDSTGDLRKIRLGRAKRK